MLNSALRQAISEVDAKNIRRHGGRKAGRIRIQQEKQRLFSQQADALSCKIKQAVLQLPDFSPPGLFRKKADP